MFHYRNPMAREFRNSKTTYMTWLLLDFIQRTAARSRSSSVTDILYSLDLPQLQTRRIKSKLIK